MSYLQAASKKATFRYSQKGKHEKYVPPSAKSFQAHGELIRDCLIECSQKNFSMNGCVVEELTLADINKISSIRIHEEFVSVNLYINTKIKPYRLKEKPDQKHSVTDLKNVSCTIEIIYTPCDGDDCPTVIVVPGKTFL